MPRLRFRNHKVVKAPKQSKKPKRVVTAIDLTRSPPKPVRTNRAAELPQNHATAINTLAQTNSCLTQQLFEKTELLLQTEEKYIAHLGNCYKLKMENERLRKENAELKARLEPIIQLDEGLFIVVMIFMPSVQLID